MHPAIEQLQKVLKLEVEKGYPNKAIIGGLPKMLGFWEPNARRAGCRDEFIQDVAGQLRAYPDLNPEGRASAVEAILKLVDALPAPAPPDQRSPRPAQTPEQRQGSAIRPPTGTPPPAAAAPRTAAPLSSAPHAAATRPAPQAQAPTIAPSGTATPVTGSKSDPSTLTEPQVTRPAPTVTPPPPHHEASPRPMEAAPSALQQGPSPAASLDAPSISTPVEAATFPTSPAQTSQPALSPAGTAPSLAQRPAAARGGRTGAPGKLSANTPAARSRREPGDYGEEPVEPRARRPSGPRPLTAETPVNPDVGLDAPVTVLRGVGPETAHHYEHLGVNTLRDLLLYYPRRYDDYSRLKTINRLEFGEECTVIGTITQAIVRPMRGRNGAVFKLVLSDPTGALELTFFNQAYLARQLTPGRQIVISGRISEYLGRLNMVPKEWEDLDRDLLSTGRIVPVYPASADIASKLIRKHTAQVVQYWAAKQIEPLPAAVVERTRVMKYGDALAQIHFPDNQEHLAAAQHRLAFDELLLLQLGVLRQRRLWQSNAATPLSMADADFQAIEASLPYQLTAAQKRALGDVRNDMARAVPMNRLLQGDVASGKTVVAGLAMAVAVQAGAQAAIMAPTSILAEQHFRTLSGLLAPVLGAADSGTIRLLQGSSTALEKEDIYAGLRSGEITAVVGTHALIESPVEFANLGLVVVDEQHRFGVAQRAALRGKGRNPHLLVMTATPIPRSLALTIYGDLDVSVLDESPPGRQAIQTHLLSAPERERGYAFIRSQVQKGRQAFVIFPLVEESEKIDAKAAVAEHQRLQSDVFPEFRVGLLHGRLKPGDKEDVMSRFRAGEFQVLVSTAVVEVGVDVPNASVMLIEGANRFGLAQLHQFRGRVGRGEQASFCLLVSDAPQSHLDERLKAMVDSQDGFFLAEKDLELRGPGDFLGTRQSGFAGLQMARLSDLPTIEKARREARLLFETDPDLRAPEHQALSEKLAQFWTAGAADAS